jgi:hypothetical protein
MHLHILLVSRWKLVAFLLQLVSMLRLVLVIYIFTMHIFALSLEMETSSILFAASFHLEIEMDMIDTV